MRRLDGASRKRSHNARLSATRAAATLQGEEGDDADDLGLGDDAMRLSELTAKYIADPRYLSTSRSKETYERHIGQFIAYLHARQTDDSVGSLTIENVEGFVQSLQERGAGNATVNLAMSAVSGVATYAMHQRVKGKPLLDQNPVSFIKRPKITPPAVRYLTLDELRALRAVECAANERVALLLMTDQPLRASEWAAAKVKDLRQDGDDVTLQVRVKGGRFVEKVLGSQAADALYAHLREREAGPEETLLVNRAGKPYDRCSLSAMLSRLAVRAGITRVPVRAHLLRHTLATLADSCGASLHEIAAMLNQRGTNTVKRYVHARPDTALSKIRHLLVRA